MKYTVADLVPLRITIGSTVGARKKLLPKYRGSIRIHAILPNDSYDIKDMRERVKRFRMIITADQIKVWVIIQNCDQDDSK